MGKEEKHHQEQTPSNEEQLSTQSKTKKIIHNNNHIHPSHSHQQKQTEICSSDDCPKDEKQHSFKRKYSHKNKKKCLWHIHEWREHESSDSSFNSVHGVICHSENSEEHGVSEEDLFMKIKENLNLHTESEHQIGE